MFVYRTAGESHGPCLTVMIEGVPAGIKVSADEIDADLARRQTGHGRGGRMAIEKDRVQITGGVRWGLTTGAPVAMTITNRDWENWQDAMSPDAAKEGAIGPLTKVRPGHADFPGVMKYGHTDARNILERSSARETASRVAAGAVAKAAIKLFDIRIGSFVDSIGGVECPWPSAGFAELHRLAETSDVRMADPVASESAMRLIDQARSEGDTLGGTFICFATGLPVGLGSHVSGDRRLDGMLGAAMLSIPAIKAVEIGKGFECARLKGSEVHDRIYPGTEKDRRRGLVMRKTNNAGGLEGGMTNGETLWLKAAMKPIPTLMSPLETVDITDGSATTASKERSDVCAVPAASVVGEAMLALVLAGAFYEKFGPDSIGEAERNFASYIESVGSRWRRF